eukprot:CAMPEP_0206482156 /NCGR_PEP_ID=MMETSP0324_2-20121206/38696_1 /ASSEMBLY_ACC=CAM_ASM_000836 /TAXON_ID=2866 /ORGANISM="Crypthecodinium cohnii, Strain Seligo" /LENGTH=315 /DNA_ID=CAMNT_0053960029 /DNA_START=16 /DNA_END=963 /DNA_ORIENTATION=+
MSKGVPNPSDLQAQKVKATDNPTKWLLVLLLFWVGTSIPFNCLTPMLVAMVDNQDVTFLELLVTISYGFPILKQKGVPTMPPRHKIPKWLGVGMLHLLGCRCFVWGLQSIPISLAQTIRAASPMVAVPISFLFFGERYPLMVLLPLSAILVGFGLSVGATGAGSDLSGAAAAVASLCCLVLVNGACKSENAHPLSVQFWVCLCAWITLCPLWLFSGGPQRLLSFDGSRLKLVALCLADGGMYYSEQAAQNQIIQLVPFLSFSVIDTLRRLAIVCVSGFLVQGNPCTMLNGFGIALVLSGAIGYNYLKESLTKKVD